MSVRHEQREQIIEIRWQAQDWFDRQIAIARASLGSFWPAHEEWVRDYLKAELLERLIARGWRPRDGG